MAAGACSRVDRPGAVGVAVRIREHRRQGRGRRVLPRLSVLLECGGILCRLCLPSLRPLGERRAAPPTRDSDRITSAISLSQSGTEAMADAAHRRRSIVARHDAVAVGGLPAWEDVDGMAVARLPGHLLLAVLSARGCLTPAAALGKASLPRKGQGFQEKATVIYNGDTAST